MVADFIEDMGFDQKLIDDELYKKWAIDATKLISTDEQLKHNIALLTVKNYKAELPDDIKIVCEVAFKQNKEEEKCGSKKERIIQYTQSTADDCEIEINLKCPKCHKFECKGCNNHNDVVVDVDRIWEMSNTHYHYSSKFMRVSHFGQGYSAHTDMFRLMRHTTSDWFGVQHMPKCLNLNCPQCVEEYSIQFPNIEVSFEEGELLISYLGQMTDENGDIMVPNHPSVIEAISEHLHFKHFKRDYAISKRMEDYRAYVDARQHRDQAIGRARSAMQIPSFQDWTQYLSKNKNIILDNALENLYERGYSGPNKRLYNGKNRYKSR